MEPTNWTPAQGPARTAVERATHHVWRYRILWYAIVVAMASLSLQISGVHA